MLEIENIQVRSLLLRSLRVSWEVKPTPEETLDYDFRVMRSEAQGGPWDPVTDWFTDRFVFHDNIVPPYNANRRLFYLIQVRRRSNPAEVKEFGPGYQTEEPDLIAVEVRRHWEVHLRELVGYRAWLFPVRTFGTTCRNCFDKTTQRVIDPGCKSCFGTGYARGYHHPIEIWPKIDPTPTTTQTQGVILTQKSITRMIIGGNPQVKDKDLIVMSDNRRWRVAGITETRRLNSTLHQELSVVECERGDVSFDVPVNFDLLRADLAAPRNYRYRTTMG